MEQLYRIFVLLSLYVGKLLFFSYPLFGQLPEGSDSVWVPVHDPDSTEFISIDTIAGNFRPGYITHGNKDSLFVFNNKYEHNILIYNKENELVNIIDNAVYTHSNPSNLSYEKGRGTPIMGLLTHGGKYLWSIHYQKYGEDFVKSGIHKCEGSQYYKQGFISKVNIHTSQLEYKFPVGTVPEYMEASSDGQRIVVSNSCSQEIYIFNPQEDSLLKIIRLPDVPADIAIDYLSRYLYVTQPASSRIARIDLYDYQIKVFDVDSHSSPMNIATSPISDEIFVSMSASSTVSCYQVINDTLKLLQSVKTGRAPRNITINTKGTFLYVANYLSNNVVKIRTSDLKIVGTVSTSPKPMGLSWEPSRSRLYVTSYENNTISIFEERIIDINKLDPFTTTYTTISQDQSQTFPDTLTSTNQSPDTSVTDTASTSPFTSRYDTDSDPFAEDGESYNKAATFASDSSYSLILGSFRDMDNANGFLSKLYQQGINAEVMSDDSKLYRVSYGNYSSLNQAREARLQFVNDWGISAWVKLR